MFGIGFGILPVLGLFYLAIAVLLVLAIWVAILGIRALRLYLRINSPATSAPPREN